MLEIFSKIAISNFSDSKFRYNEERILKWLSKISIKEPSAVLIRELYWYNQEKQKALEIVHLFDLIPILHNAKIENPYGYYHWDSTYIKKRPIYKGIHGISCHNIEDILIAEKMGYHYAFLSPIYKTESHPYKEPLGLNYLKDCVNRSKIPLIALGGIRSEHQIEEIQKSGAKGFASIRYFEKD